MDYHKIVLVHRIVVSLFLLHYVVKGYFLIADKKETLANYTAKTKIGEMILSLLFLATGFYLVAKSPALSTLMYIKLGLVFASIPIAIIGFKRGNKILAFIAVLFLVFSYGLAEVNKKKMKEAKVDTTAVSGDLQAVGKAVYSAQCTSCHGETGDANVFGAKNLRTTQLSDEQMREVIHKGVPNTQMHGFEGLTDDQITGLVAYIKTLK